MPVDDQNEEPSRRPSNDEAEVEDRSPPASDPSETQSRPERVPKDATAKPLTKAAKHRRYLTRRNAVVATAAIALVIVALLLVGFLGYRLGYADRLIAGQIQATLAEYGIRSDFQGFSTKLGARSVLITNVGLYDATSGAQLGKVDRIYATVRVTDLYSLSLKRHLNLESMQIEGLEAWVQFDKDGLSNLRNLRMPPPSENSRILFDYSTGKIQVDRALIHYGDVSHDVSGDARNLSFVLEPEDPNEPIASRANAVSLSSSNSTLKLDGNPVVENIDLGLRARINQGGAQITDLTLKSPFAEAELQGNLSDWQALKYQMQITSTVDLMQAAELFQTAGSKVAVRGVGKFSGSVAGEGTKYQVDGGITSDALAADNVRLRAFSLTAKGSGDGASYDLNGRAVAELLNAGAFQLNAVQLAGGVMGTGSDFRWLGELRAAAARGPGLTIAGLILSDVSAEMRDKALSVSARRANVNSLVASGANVSGARMGDLRARYDNGETTASIGTLQAGAITASGARISNVAANGVEIKDRDGNTNVTAGKVEVGGLTAAGATTGSINIAGVRLAISNGRAQGSSDDINVGAVTIANTSSLQGGRIDNVNLAHPTFTVEPQGRYRASADLSLGGGVLGQINLGAAKAAVVASNNQIQLNNFSAQILDGSASGNASIATGKSGASRVAANFKDLDIGKLLSVVSRRVLPVAGKTTGDVDISFPGTDAKLLSGKVRADFVAETGTEANGRTPLTGDIALRADRGLLNIEQANLHTSASQLAASGQFSLTNSESNLQVNLNSSDAQELQNIIANSGLLPSVDDQLNKLGITIGGKFAFNGAIKGNLDQPEVNGRASLDSVKLKDRDIGSLSAVISSTASEMRISEGRLAQPEGGGVQFSLNAPLAGQNNIAVDATLDRVHAGTILALLPFSAKPGSIPDIQSDVSGRLNVTGLPSAMSGNADVRFGAGQLGGEAFDSIVARATFKGSEVNLESLDAHFSSGSLNVNGTYNTASEAFDLQANATGVKLDLVRSLAGNSSAIPQLAGTADLKAHATGIGSDYSSYQVNFDGEGRNVSINGKPAGTLALVGRTENKQLNINFTTGLLNKPQVITAKVDLSNEALPTYIETTFTATDLTPLFAALMPDSNVKVNGRATGTIKASGNLRSLNSVGQQELSLLGLRGTANFTELSFQMEDVQLTAASPLIVQFASNEVVFQQTRFTGPGTNVVFGGTAAIGAGGRENLTVDGSINLQVLGSLSPNLFPSGAAEIAVRVGGSYEQPRINGSLTLAGASLSGLFGDQRLTLANVKGQIRFNSNQAEIQSLTGTLGGGQISASGGALLVGFTPSRFRFLVSGTNVVVPYPEDFRSAADADLEISGTARAQVISGTVHLRRAEYTKDIDLAELINRRRDVSLTEGGGGDDSSIIATTQVDLSVEGRDALVVHNNIADVVGSVSLRITGPLTDPIVAGRITATRGTLSFRNDRYELTRAYIDLPGRSGADPLLNIEAESEIKGYRINVGLTGPLSQPQATLRSDPSLPQSDVVSLITTGNLSSPDTGGSVLAQSGVGTAASLLTDALINNRAQKATNRLFGLNRFELDPLVSGRGGGSPTARLTVGRQINKNLSVTYSTNVTSDQNQVLALEYRVSNRLSFIAQYEQGSTKSLTTRNDNFSFEIRFQKRF